MTCFLHENPGIMLALQACGNGEPHAFVYLTMKTILLLNPFCNIAVDDVPSH